MSAVRPATQASASSPVPLFGHDKYWAECFGSAPFLPMSRAEMDQLGWDACDIIIVTGDAYVDHPSFGMAIIGRLLEAQGFRVGIIAQPDWNSAEPFKALGEPTLFFGVAAGNMDSMINRYTADRKIRSDDAYSPGGEGGRRPDRCSIVYAQRTREAYPHVPIVMGGIEASLRRIAHYDYWQDKVRRSLLLDAKADILVYGNAERAIVEVAHRLAKGENIRDITDLRGTAFLRRDTPEGWFELESTDVDHPGRVDPIINPYVNTQDTESCEVEKQKSDASPVNIDSEVQVVTLRPGNALKHRMPPRDKTVIRLPSYEQVKGDPVYYAHANRVLHLETNPGNARALVQRHGDREVWINPPPIPLSTEEMDYVFDLPYARVPHPAYGDARIPAYEMIRFSVNIMRGCFGGCTFCSITEHEGRIIQNRSEDSIIREIEQMRTVPGFTGIVSDLGGPTANMYRLACKSPKIEAACRKPSCVYPDICDNLGTDHSHLIELYRRARKLPGVKKILIGSGLRYDLAVRSPEYVRELVTHHVGGYLKIAPEHTEGGPLSKMMKPGIGAFDRFKQMFDRFSKEAGKEQYLIPYFIAAHPGTTDADMMNLAVWLKKNGFRADQVQTFYPSPMATATAMYHSGKNPLRKVTRDSETVDIVKGDRRRRLHKAFLRYHDPNNWPLLRDALKAMGRADLIGNGKHHLIPTYQPVMDGTYQTARKKNSSVEQGKSQKVTAKKGRILTQHTGLPPRETGAGKAPMVPKRPVKKRTSR
ncbi:MAG: YgiQ family radical SAM protein [Fluviicoccus sp.]|uniref:YgiQ family radical SAM protein n=1 Tax=Fluviicoccus sp. TaxID=2003552 RepID=UPI00271DC154|nr:YgiQ family radical SAM protein [Fluviicoccus sp.]MDO8332282.1 YgiQ family radical SAM protein [Fluviicoccus sp.]